MVTVLRIWRRKQIPAAIEVFIAGLCVTYLLMPLVHYIIFTNGHFYISDSDNFFATNAAMQALTWLIVAAMVFGLTRLRERLAPFANLRR
jgi:hypothetical protein